MASIPVSESPDLTTVFGPLDDEQSARISELLEGAQARMTGVHEHLTAQGSTWKTDGVVVSNELSGQASVDILIEEANGKVTFEAQLRPRNYFPTEEGMWQPGRPPLKMATDGWDADGGVSVRFKTRVANRPYTIQEQVSELAEKRYATPVEAAEGFAAMCDKLAKLASSREPTVLAWKPDAAS
ncbi:MAG TPA: hypothetical protein VGM80_02520 [Gaiellaceae bacterium]|jgi:hypothetical protein